MKEMIIKELKKEFFPFDEDKFQAKIEEKFTRFDSAVYQPDSYYFIDKMYGKKITVVYEKTVTLIFIQNTKELVIMMITDFHGFERYDSLKTFSTRSVTKVDLIAEDSWFSENKDIVNITELVSRNSSHIGNEYLIKGSDKILGFEESQLQSPLLWFLLRDPNPVQARQRTRSEQSKTKNNFVPGLIRVISNSINKNDSISKKNMTNTKDKLFSYMISKLLRANPRKFLMADLKSRNGLIFGEALFSDLFASLKYNRETWTTYLNGELIPYLQDDFKNHLFSLTVENKMRDNIVNNVYYTLYDNPKFKKLMKKNSNYLTREVVESILLNNDREYYNSIIDELTLFVDANFNDILSATYIKRTKNEVKPVPFADDLFEKIADDIIDRTDEAFPELNSQVHSIPAINIEDEDNIPF